MNLNKFPLIQDKTTTETFQCCGGINKPENKRKYLPSTSDLIDRLAISLLKRIWIPEHKESYDEEIKDICHDINIAINEKNIKLDAECIKAILMIMLSNRVIWENESKARSGQDQDLSLLLFTHSINGRRNKFKNVLSEKFGERLDKKVDCLAAELKSEFQNWDF